MGRQARKAWPFREPRDTFALTLGRIKRKAGAPILLVSHDEDGDWQFLDGKPIDQSEAIITDLGEMFDLDPSLEPIADLPLGWQAWRDSPGAPWHRALRPPSGD